LYDSRLQALHYLRGRMTLQLREYQKRGVEFLLSRPLGLPHALLADAPGTGKTIMAIEAAKRAHCRNGIILVPATIKEQWRRQMIKWGLAAEDEIQILYGLDAKVDSRPWVIANYELVREDAIRRQLAARKWHLLVEDEAHRLKNHTSQQSKAVFHKSYGLAHSCYYKWPMSGSIMPNRPAELYPILRTHFPQILETYFKDGREFPDVSTWEKYRDRYCGGAFAQAKGATNILELTARIQPVMLRRELRDVWAECPKLIENEVWLDVPFEQHPEWVGAAFLNESAQRRIVAEAKIPYTVSYLKQRLDDGIPKLCVITFHRAVADGIESALADYKPLKIYGGISSKQREISLAKFRQDPRHRLIILQIMSAGEGVDGLQTVCAEYVLSEPEWCPGREDQAGRRILRLGQTSNIVIETKLIAARSFEEVIHQANLRKQKVIDVVLKPNGGNFTMGLLESMEARIAALEAKLNAAAPAAPVVPAPVAPALAPVAPAPVAPMPTSAPAPVVPAPVVPAPVAPMPTPAPAPVAPAPVAPAPDTSFAGFPSVKEFGDHCVQLLMALGMPAGPNKLKEICTTFGIDRVGNLPAEQAQNFLAHVQAAVSGQPAA
jgi:SNF2 family DNA or RNA helicase